MKTIQLTKNKGYAVKREWNGERWLYTVYPQRKFLWMWFDGDFNRSLFVRTRSFLNENDAIAEATKRSKEFLSG